MPKTLKEVCDTLINKYGHQALWLDMRSGANGPGLYQSKQPVVISCSRRDLAEHDGKKWHLLNSPLYLDFDPVDDSVNSITATDIYLDDAAIETYMHWNSL
ncbi:MAG: hypothetical protein E6840_17420 [Klebsiella pneumoniae]|uniref:Uncharacterized protein n=1 Tax=Klebsiella variicola TaxID=244366 RepID=A0AAW9PQV5_KLEVA|nr:MULTISPECIES: hypothetical protein [Enterobacteriaceae]EKZ5468234.1 hypothetical protein [Klebsiella quasipneumoniae]MDU7381692.1 hypothetical protein [Enterobacteriaceae bacterium]EKU2007282.1 hypothetical protein [Klebsiella pneumoniae]EKZ5479200.1 hypothetical protein [Klebsiella quasipneumoniae]EKZ5643965.1 hypothetical protein [Klebsiella quasipneumoniae]